jgi:hypothetical protein
MKKIVPGIILIFAIFCACQKEQEFFEDNPSKAVNASNSVTVDKMNDILAQVLSLAINDINVRLMLHSEISKQFTFDFDILYSLIKDREIISGKCGLVKFSELLQKTAQDAGIDFSLFDQNSLIYKNLQISSPVYFEEWDPETTDPVVISLPEDYQEESESWVNAFKSDGSQFQIKEKEITGPILLVRKAERVDENGMMSVDPDGFVIPEEERTVTAIEAYDAANHQLKSGSVKQHEPVIEVLNSVQFEQKLQSRRSLNDETNYKSQTMTGPAFVNTLKSGEIATISAPANFSVHPAGPYTIQLNWTPVAGAVAYEIFRQNELWPNSLLNTVNETQINYFDQNLYNGEHYVYSIRAVDASGNRSVLSNGLEAYASWRNNGSRDIIDKIYIDSDCWNWCCGLFDGKIELQYKTSYLITPSNTNVAYPASGVNSLGQKTKDQQRNKWCYYNHYLFPWDVRSCSYSYRFKLIENDGSGDGQTIKLGCTFKVQIAKIVELSATPSIEFKIADKDEEFGEMIIVYWERSNGPDPYTDGYNLMPDRGNARMYFRQ